MVETSQNADRAGGNGPPEIDWRGVIPVLVDYAATLLWHHAHGGSLPSGGGVRELSQGAAFSVMSKVLHRKRKWDRTRFPNPIVPLKGMVMSEINHHVDSWYNQHVAAATNVARETAEGVVLDPIENAASDMATPLDELVAKEDKADKVAFEQTAERFFWGVHKSLADEPELQKCLDLLLVGKRPAEIGPALGLAAKDVYNMEKKIRIRFANHAGRTGFSLTNRIGGKNE